MYAVINKPETEIPVVINTNNNDFPTYLMSGYEIIYEGHKKDCLEIEAAMLEEFKTD